MAESRIRLMTAEDLEFADSLRAIAGWNQTVRDWRRFLEIDPNGCFIAERDDKPAGTATTIRYENKIAWIGMVLVHPEQRRHGIGRGLLFHCIDYLKKCGVECIKLDATPLGKKLYDTLGFVDEWTMTRWRGVVEGGVAKQFDTINLREIAEFDEAAFGVNRLKFLEKLAADCETVFLEDRGFAFRRKGFCAAHFGPVVANSAEVAFQLMEALLRPGELIIDIPDSNTAASQWAKSVGLVPERQLTRMRRGKEIRAAAPETLFAIASPEVG